MKMSKSELENLLNRVKSNFRFEYVGGGYFRDKTAQKGIEADILHGSQVLDEFCCELIREYSPPALTEEALPTPPDALSFGAVRLRFVRVVPGEPSRGFVPYYHFRILTIEGLDVGHINFRVGDTEHVRLCAGHIGFEVLEAFRGHHYAFEACRAIAPFVRSVYDAVTITCDPDNGASIRTIERLGAAFVDQVAVPPHDPQYQRGSRSKRRYSWKP